MKKSNTKLDNIRMQIVKGGGEARAQQQHEQGKLTARERLALLFDKDSFMEYNVYRSDINTDDEKINGDGVITGVGFVDGRKVCAYIQDFTVSGGTVGKDNSKKIDNIQKLAMELKVPIVSMLDSGGAKIQDGVQALAGYGQIFKNNVLASGVIPQISVIMGPCAGGAAYAPALTDFIFMVEDTSYMFITGPDVISTVTGEKIDKNSLGGANVHTEKSGVAHFKCKDDKECIKKVRELLKRLPDNSDQKVEISKYRYNSQLDIDAFVPKNKRVIYDMKVLINAIFDENSLIEIQEDYAKNIVTALATIKGITVGVVANQPTHLAGSLDINGCDKASRFVNFCSLFNIPIINFVDIPGYMPGRDQETSGIIRHGAKMLYAYSKSNVPKMTVIVRKAYGGAYLGMCSKETGADYVVAWDNAEIAVMGAEGAVRILNKKEINNSDNPEELVQEKTKEYNEKFLNPYYGAKLGYIDNIIKPEETRLCVYNFVRLHYDREVNQVKSGNFPV